MSARRVSLLAAAFALALRSGAAWPAVGAGHAGGGFAGGHGGAGLSRGRGFGDGRPQGRPFPHRHGGPRITVFPYFYDPYWPDDLYPYDAYCDEYSPYYSPEYCYWDEEP